MNFLLLFIFSSPVCQQHPPALPLAKPAEAGMSAERLSQIEPTIQQAMQQGQIPGAVILVLHQGKICYREAFGLRSREPTEIPMTTDTVFDLASLTKPIATASSLMILLEQGKFHLQDPVSRYLPEFGRNGKEKITIEQLLLHTSGLIADNPVEDYRDGRAKALERIYQLAPQTEPGSKFTYSDVGYIVLGELVEKLSGESLDRFSQKRIFEPLGLSDTTFKPSARLAEQAAPTEQRDGQWLKGTVHDPRAFAMSGVAGHAGLFSTSDNLAVYVQMLLNQGEFNGKRILRPTTVQLMTKPRSVPGGFRALGWDVQTSYSSNRGELFPFGSFGHTGFTGTSIWIDPSSQTAVIFLSNRVHPKAKGNINQLRGRVSTLVASSITALNPKSEYRNPKQIQCSNPRIPNQTGGQVLNIGASQLRFDSDFEFRVSDLLTGIDVLKRDRFRLLRGRRIGIVTNHTGVDRQGNRTIDLLHQVPDVKLVAIFSPEHGVAGQFDSAVADAKDSKTGLPIYSLFGKRQRPTAEQLRDIDTLVYDIQDIGCRFYTYLTTLGYILEAAAEHKLRVFVSDRPNPIGGMAVEGPVLDRKLESFTGYHPLPVRHGMTVGELAGLFNSERKINADLQVIPMHGWRREFLFDQTGLAWVNPSPNMRNLTADLLYPGIGLLETTNLSVGRGTDRPFEIIGAPWLDGRRLADALTSGIGCRGSGPAIPDTRHPIPEKGVRFVPTRFAPSGSVYAGKECGGVQIFLDDWRAFSPLKTGLAIAYELHRLYPNDWKASGYQKLLAHPPTNEALLRGDSLDKIYPLWQAELDKFLDVRKRYLLY